MPHLHIKEFKTVSLPQQGDAAAFHFMAHNVHHKDEYLIATEVEGEDFFFW